MVALLEVYVSFVAKKEQASQLESPLLLAVTKRMCDFKDTFRNGAE